MRRYYATKAVQDARGRWIPKTHTLLVSGVDYDPAAGEGFSILAPLQDPTTGALLMPWFFVIANVRDHTKLLADTDCTACPDFSPDGKWGAIGLAVRTAFKAALSSKLGFTAAEVTAIDGKDDFRGVLDGILAKLQPGVSLANIEAAASPTA